MIKQILISIVCGFVGALLFTKLNPVGALASSQHIESTQGVVTAKGFNLVDGNGRLRAQLGFAKEGQVPGLWVMDDKGVARIIMGLYADNTSYFGLQDAQGQMIELMRSFGSQEAPLLIFKNKGQDKMITGLNPGSNPIPFLMSYDANGTKQVHFGTYEGP